METIRASGEALLALINDILDFSKMESGKLAIERAPFSLEAVIEESLEIVAPLAARQGLALRSAIAEGTPEALVGDRARTRQVLVNLLGNAVKFTPRGEVRRVAFRPSAGRTAAGKPHFAVTDTGVGIAPERSEPALRRLPPARRLADPPARRHRPRPRHQQAAGRAHGRPDLGREHRRPGLDLPLHHRRAKRPRLRRAGRLSQAAGPRPGAAATRCASCWPRTTRSTSKVMLALLEHLGYQRGPRANGPEVLEALERQPYDVILMDVQMPELDGLEATRRIRRELPGTASRTSSR